MDYRIGERNYRTARASSIYHLYITDFGKADDWCLVAEVKEKIAGAVWVRIMND